MPWRFSDAVVRRLMALMALGLMAAHPAWGQFRVVRGGAVADGAAGEPQQGVYVRDSAVATDKFELGRRMERLREWHKSADVYQEILEKYQDRVIPVGSNDRGQVVKYASVTVAVRQRLARWPEEGLAVYRARYEPLASMQLEQAPHGDYRALHDILSRYFVTEAAKQAGIRLIDLYLESGEFMAAAWIGQQILEWHPGLQAERPAVLFRTALAHHLAGQAEAAGGLLEQLKAKHPNELASIAGKDRLLVDALSEQLRQPPPTATGRADDSWPTFGGDSSRGTITAGAGVPGARVYSIELPGPNLEGLNEQARRAMTDAHNQARTTGAAINVMPVADRGQLFFQDGYRVYAVHLDSGLPLPGWAATHGGSHAGQFWLPAGPNAFYNMMGMEQWQFAQMLTPRQQSLTVTEDAVLAVMGQPPVRFQLGPVPVQDAGTRLVCLDRVSGRQRWSVTPQSGQADRTNSRNLSFSGSPLVVGDGVYVIARGSSAAGVEDCHVVCYSLADGEYRWSSYVASSQTGVGNMGGGFALNQDADSLSHLAFASGRIYVLTNLGAVAAIDAYSGATAWLTIYPRDEQAMAAVNQRMVRWGGGWNTGVGNAAQQPKPWELNAAIVRDGHVFVLPSDGKHILVYNAGTGQEVKRIPCDIEYGLHSSMKLTMLLAVSGSRLIAAGPEGVMFLDWTRADPVEPGSRKLNEAAILYPQTFAGGIKGRPFVTSEQVYVPGEAALFIISIPRTKVVMRFPRDPATWAPEEGPGNVLVTRDHVVVAGARSVCVYTDLAAVRAKYAAAIRSDPGNVEARLVFSELMFNANEIADAKQALDEAIQVLGGLGALRPGALRDRVFTDAMLFAQRVAAQGRGESMALADALFDRAAAAAQSPEQQVAYRVGRAAFIEASGSADLGRAVQLYQQVLSSPEMRAIPLPGAEGTSITAGRKAQAAIAQLIARAGPGIYAAFEQQAAAALAALGDAKDPAPLLALAEEYPHSTAAPKALMQAAAIHQRANQPRLATIVLRRLYWEYHKGFTDAQRAQLAEAIARNYLASGNLPAALGRLQRIGLSAPDARLSAPLVVDGKPLLTRDGQVALTLRQAAEALQVRAAELSGESLPDVALPLPLTAAQRQARQRLTSFAPAANATMRDVQALIKPPGDLPEAGRHDRLVVWSGGRLVCVPAGSSQPLWTSAALAQEPAALAWMDNRLLAWNAVEAALFDGQTGKLAWKTDLKTLPTAPEPGGDDDVVEEPEPAAVQLQQRRLFEAQIVIQRVNGVAVPVRNVRAQPAVGGPERIVHVRPLSDRVILATSTGRVAALDLSGGLPIWQMRATRGDAIRQLLANDDFTVIRAGTQPHSLVVLDSYSGQTVWRLPIAAGQAMPLNCALAPDGTLIWTTQQTIAAKDLYEAGDAPTWERRGQIFSGLQNPEQLAVYGQEVLAVCNGGQLVMSFSLRRGEQARGLINARGSDPTTRLRLAGPRVYIIGSRAVIAHHLEEGTSVPIESNSDVACQVQDAMLTRDYLILPGAIKPSPWAAQPAGDSYALQAYSRALVPNSDTGKSTESGLLVHRYDFAEPAKVKAWQAVDGGVHYLAQDGSLRFLRGTRN